MALWRGQHRCWKTRLETFPSLQRYQLADTLEQPGLLDARFSAVVQTASTEAERVISQHLVDLDLLRPAWSRNTWAAPRLLMSMAT